MCGPIVTSIVLEKNSYTNYNIYFVQFFYHSGRIFTYSILGFVMGYLGSFVNIIGKLTGLSNFIVILVGIYLILKGLEMLGILKKLNIFFLRLEGLTTSFTKFIFIFRDINSLWKYFLYGLVLGFLPCGLSYTAFITSSALHNPFKSFLFMFIFGLANIPALMMIVSFSFKAIYKTRNILYFITAFIFIFTGIFFLYKNLPKIF
jgi:sulfite exporter TauE/SafE